MESDDYCADSDCCAGAPGMWRDWRRDEWTLKGAGGEEAGHVDRSGGSAELGQAPGRRENHRDEAEQGNTDQMVS